MLDELLAGIRSCHGDKLVLLHSMVSMHHCSKHVATLGVQCRYLIDWTVMVLRACAG
jgi:hypothetical protein